MMKIDRLLVFIAGALSLLSAGFLFGQVPDINTVVTTHGGKPALAVIDFRGSGASQGYMAAFNSTLFGDLQSSALFDMRPKSVFPLNNPQRPEDLRPTDGNQGLALPDWAGAPVNASHLVFGYTADVNGSLVLYGNVYDTRQADPGAAKLMSSRYAGTLNEAGAIHLAHQFADDIIKQFGGTGSLLGSRIYFSSNRSSVGGDIWVMDWDGNNQTQLTNQKAITIMPAISPDGSRLAFTSYASGTPKIVMLDTVTKRTVPFYNQEASLNANVTFSPDGKSIYYVSTAAGGTAQIYYAAMNGQGFRRISHRDAVESEPKINPANPNLMLFTGGPGSEQIYQMSTDGVGVEKVTNGEGEASNPSWNADGKHFLFAWTSGIAKGDFNIFVMDAGSRQYTQLTHNEGRNENPVWAPDGKHLVFASTRSGRSQIYSMLADGSDVKQLTTRGTNKSPVWGVK
jgi:TolB protein